jgi:membrane-associated phospholipid phosphatase
MTLFENIGTWAPLFFIVFTGILLRNKKTYLAFYIVGTIFNIILNLFLKLIIKDPRPFFNRKTIEIALENGEYFYPDIYGMPSGHSQIMAFNLIYILFTLKSEAIFLLYLIFSIITCAQRYINLKHTLLQIFVGLCIGFIIGFISYYLANSYLKGKLQFRPDDNGPL